MPKKQKKIITLDAETDPFSYGDVPKPFTWGVYDGDYFWHTWNSDTQKLNKDLIEYLSDYPDGSIVYAHNGGKFDFHFLLEYLDADLMIINGRIAKATILQGKIELRDSYLILPIPLKQFVKDDIDYNKMTKENREKNRKEIVSYLKTDCEALYEITTKFIKRFGLNLTLAGTAIKELKKTGYEIERTSERYDSKFRSYYFGGRVQTFKTGSFYAEENESLKYVDINSAYPRAMIDRHWYGSEYREGLKLPECENGSYLATISAVSKGALPFKSDKLYFPDDDTVREYNVTGWEIIAGLETGALDIKEVKRVYTPVKTASFSDYINYWYDEKARCKGTDKAGYIFAKLMQNSAYGKFGQDGRNFEEFKIVHMGSPAPHDEGCPKNAYKGACECKTPWLFHSDSDAGTTFYKRPSPSDRFFNVPVAASVTGWVRAYMWRSISASEGVMYCDTDSIICKKFNGKIGKALGEWELEAELSEAHIAQRKMYALKEANKHDSYKVASKGVKLTFDQIKSGVQNKSVIQYERDAPSFSIRFGTRFIDRKINFQNIEKNACNNPQIN